MTADDYRLMTGNAYICEARAAAHAGKNANGHDDKVRVHPASPIVSVAVQ
jgi:hypothetical protein